MDSSEIIRWRLRRGICKANQELAHLTRNRANRKQKQAKYVYMLSRKEIENGDFTRLRSEFSLDLPPEKLRERIGASTVAVMGYDHTPDELFEIPEVRAYFGEVNCHWPFWTAFAALDSGLLKFVATCIAEHMTAVKRKGRLTYDVHIARLDLVQLLVNSVPLSMAICKTANLPPREIRKRQIAVATHLGL